MPTPETPNIIPPPNTDEINQIKLQGRTLLQEMQDLIQEGRDTDDQEERNKIKRKVEEKLREVNKLKRKLAILKGEIAESELTPDLYLTDLHPFLIETYKKWSYNEEQLKTVESVTSNPDNIHIGEDIPFDTLKEENETPDPKKAGEIYLSPETPDFENAKLLIPDLSSYNRKPLSEVFQHIYDTYNDTHIIPDIKYFKYLIELGDQYKSETDEKKKELILKQIPEQLRDGNYYFFPKSAFVDESGRWCCPRSYWAGGEFLRYASRLGDGWVSNYRVVLLER